MTTALCCPVCKEEGLFLKAFGEHRLYRCASCESLFYHPFPLMHRGVETPWESAKWYVERGANLLFYAEVLAHISSLLKNLPSKKQPETIDILEAGGSFGFLMDMASVLFGWNVTGADPGLCARQGSQELGRETLPCRLEDVRPGKKFDVIVGVQLIEHIQEPQALLRSMFHLLKEDGIVVLTTPDASVENLGAEYSPGEHCILFSRKGLALLLAGAGLIHCRFFSTTLPTMMGVVAAGTQLPDSFSMPASIDGAAVSKQLTLEYLTKRLRSGSHKGSLGIGLSFRLFELLVNEGRYAEASTHVRALETLMGMEGHETVHSFTARLCDRMTSASTPQDYVAAGPGCFAPYLFYKGILNVNYMKDRTEAHTCFTSATRLFEHEIQVLGLIQYAPWLNVSRTHVDLTGKAIARKRGDDAGKEPRVIQAAPFTGGGVAEFCGSVPPGRLSRTGVRGGNSFIFVFTSLEDNLSGISCDVLIRPRTKGDPVALTLHVFEEYNPVPLRKTDRVAVSGARTSLWRFSEPFCFEPIKDSCGKTYTLVLGIGKDAAKAALLCSNLEGALTVAGYRRCRNVQPVMIPYHHITAHFGKISRDRYSPLVSCLIVTYNSEGYIRNCLKSIAGQDYPHIEIVVIDNRSVDRTVDIIREEFSSVNLFVMEQNLDFCRGNNIGASKCSGEFICVLNPDVVLEQGAIRRLVEKMELSPHIAIVGSMIETKGSRTRYADTFIINGLLTNDEELLSGERFSSAPCGAGFMIRKSVVNELGYLFDEGFVSNWEDHDLGLRCWLHGYIVLHIPELGLYHYGGSAYGLADPKRESAIFRNMLLTYFKNFGKRLFLKAFMRTLLSCTRPYRMLGVMRFLGCFWKYMPERAVLQRKRKIDDSVLQVLTSGFLAVIPEDERERGV